MVRAIEPCITLTSMPPNDATEDPLYRDPDLAQFYDLENDWAEDQDYCRRLAKDAGSVLDLGCGTGRFAAALAEGQTVVGADPAAAMLAVARQRPGGDKVAWVQSDAQSLRLERTFDLIVLTGHAFQVFLTERDQKAVLATIAAHLAPEGRFIFDTRNPAAEKWREWVPGESERTIHHPEFGAVEAWNEVAHDAATGIVTYETHYRIVASGQSFSASSEILFTPRETLSALIEDAGLAVESWLGDWTGAPYTPTAPEIIPIGRLR